MEELPVSKKVVEYEHFVNEILRKDLRKVLENREEIFTQTAQYLQLKTVIEKIKGNVSDDDLKTQVDLGCNFYVQAKVPDTSKIFVQVGFGFFVEFTLTEALIFIDEKIKQLNKKCEKLTKDSATIKANIKLVYEALKELQHISDKKPEEGTVVW
ncbi:protein UXT-like [Anneissia japonica]|uniref:protein UXT-like n=1 Tax=Anneissia japonica TaxID=1529436 RepID=UPI001425608B|nr:protein UXT-like [Anneissia japonica]XP_033110968.1 protein UXT-like [Anneissia japonica]